MKAFFAGEFNCLVATCIAEEGLDIGEVDLIVSFDALNSPVRMVQRMGRTGRKRAGKVGDYGGGGGGGETFTAVEKCRGQSGVLFRGCMKVGLCVPCFVILGARCRNGARLA